MTRVNENFLPDTSGILIVTEEWDSMLFQVGHGFAQVWCLQGDMVDAALSVAKESVQKTSLRRWRDNLKPGQIAKRKELPEKFGCGITRPGTANGSQNVTEKMFSLFLVSYRYGYMVDA